jgi:hypothetical protein
MLWGVLLSSDPCSPTCVFDNNDICFENISSWGVAGLVLGLNTLTLIPKPLLLKKKIFEKYSRKCSLTSPFSSLLTHWVLHIFTKSDFIVVPL